MQKNSDVHVNALNYEIFIPTQQRPHFQTYWAKGVWKPNHTPKYNENV